MPTIKIVPFPGAPGPRGEQGPRGYQGDQGIQGNPGQDAAVPQEVSFTVNGGSLGAQPTFSSDPMFSGTYVKNGPKVEFQIQVDMDNITSFGTGQYFVDLPFAAKYAYQLRNGCIHDTSTGNQYSISGHVAAGAVQLSLWFTSGSGQDEIFDHNSPFTLAPDDSFHISGTYITAE